MKRLFVSLVFLGVASFFFGSCSRYETSPAKGYVTFSLTQGKIIGGRVAAGAASSVIITIKDGQGNLIYENHKLSLLAFGQDYISESVPLGTGNFTLTGFAILNSADEIIYASPVENSNKATLVSVPMPMSFTISKENTTQVVPEVLAVTNQDTAASFGYASFGFKVVTLETIPILVVVKLLVGEFLYENIETIIRVKGYDANGNEKWSQDFPYASFNKQSLSLNSGYSHYTISMEKWGVTDTQTITAKELSDGRADGPNPVTYGLGGKVSVVKKPIFSFEYREGPNNTFPVTSRTEYEYNSTGKIERMTFFEDYSTDSTTKIPTRYRVFTYLGGTGGVSKITEYLASGNATLFEDTYEYGVDGALLRITEVRGGINGPITGVMSLSYDASNIHAIASYQYSNGGGFDYSFDYFLKNIVDDKTTKAGELCNQGAYSYDRNINPFKHMGYVSYILDNYSANNKVSEDVNYLACAFPTLIPESYSYEYDNMGYPTKKITHYKGGQTHVSATKYYYQEFPQ